MVTAAIPRSQICSPGDTMTPLGRTRLHQEINTQVKQNKESARTRVAHGKREDEGQTVLFDIALSDSCIDICGQEIHGTLDKMYADFEGQNCEKMVSKIEAMLKEIPKTSMDCLTELGYPKMTIKQADFAAGLSKIKFSLTGTAVGGAVTFGGPIAAAKLEAWAENSRDRSFNQYCEKVGTGLKHPNDQQAHADIRRAGKNFDWKLRQVQVIRRLRSLVKTPPRAGMVGFAIQAFGIATDIVCDIASEGKKDEGKEPASDLIA